MSITTGFVYDSILDVPASGVLGNDTGSIAPAKFLGSESIRTIADVYSRDEVDDVVSSGLETVDLSSRVPYTGAEYDVDLGENGLLVSKIDVPAGGQNVANEHVIGLEGSGTGIDFYAGTTGFRDASGRPIAAIGSSYAIDGMCFRTNSRIGWAGSSVSHNNVAGLVTYLSSPSTGVVAVKDSLNNLGSLHVGKVDFDGMNISNGSGTSLLINQGTLNRFNFAGNEFRVPDGSKISFSPSIYTSLDAQIKRVAAGEIGVYQADGSLGTLQAGELKVNTPASVNTQETLQSWGVSDSESRLEVVNNTTNNSKFAPMIRGTEPQGNLALNLRGTGPDTGILPLVAITGQTEGGTTVTNRPILRGANWGTSLLEIGADGATTTGKLLTGDGSSGTWAINHAEPFGTVARFRRNDNANVDIATNSTRGSQLSLTSTLGQGALRMQHSTGVLSLTNSRVGGAIANPYLSGFQMTDDAAALTGTGETSLQINRGFHIKRSNGNTLISAGHDQQVAIGHQAIPGYYPGRLSIRGIDNDTVATMTVNKSAGQTANLFEIHDAIGPTYNNLFSVGNTGNLTGQLNTFKVGSTTYLDAEAGQGLAVRAKNGILHLSDGNQNATLSSLQFDLGASGRSLTGVRDVKLRATSNAAFFGTEYLATTGNDPKYTDKLLPSTGEFRHAAATTYFQTFHTNGVEALRLDTSQNATFSGNVTANVLYGTNGSYSNNLAVGSALTASRVYAGARVDSRNEPLQINTPDIEKVVLNNSDSVHRQQEILFRFAAQGDGGCLKSDGPLTFYSGIGSSPHKHLQLTGASNVGEMVATFEGSVKAADVTAQGSFATNTLKMQTTSGFSSLSSGQELRLETAGDTPIYMVPNGTASAQFWRDEIEFFQPVQAKSAQFALGASGYSLTVGGGGNNADTKLFMNGGNSAPLMQWQCNASQVASTYWRNRSTGVDVYRQSCRPDSHWSLLDTLHNKNVLYHDLTTQDTTIGSAGNTVQVPGTLNTGTLNAIAVVNTTNSNGFHTERTRNVGGGPSTGLYIESDDGYHNFSGVTDNTTNEVRVYKALGNNAEWGSLGWKTSPGSFEIRSKFRNGSLKPLKLSGSSVEIIGDTTSDGRIGWGGMLAHRNNGPTQESYDTTNSVWQQGYGQEATAVGLKASVYGAPRVLQGATIADADGTLVDVNDKLNELLAAIRAFGIIAT